MRSRIRLRQTLLVLKTDSGAADAVHRRILHFLAPLWSQVSQGKIRSKVILDLRIDQAIARRSGLFLFQTRVAEVRFRFGAREIFHFGAVGVTVKERAGVRHIITKAPSSESLFESAWATLLSVFGEDGDRAGFHRVHALGLQVQSQGVLLFSGGGVGKSTFCREVLDRTLLHIYGDEIPLLDRHGEMTACPLPIAIARDEIGIGDGAPESVFLKAFFGEKILVPILPSRWAKASRIRHLIWMRSGATSASLSYVSRWKIAFALFRHLVIGEGVPQMAEFVLRFKNVPWLFVIFVGRLQTWFQALRQSEAWILDLSANSEEGWQLLCQKIFGIQTIAREDRQVLSAASNNPRELRSVFDSDGNLGRMT